MSGCSTGPGFVIKAAAVFLLCIAVAPAAERRAAVAAAHPAAVAAGLEMLAAGGNAFDAAVAVSAALAVVEPYASGLGGGGFWLLHHEADDRQWMLDGRERAPMAVDGTVYLDENGEVVPERSRNGPLSAAIPGVPRALARLSRYGCLSFAQQLASAVRLAGNGFEVGERYRRLAAYRLEVLQSYPAAAEVFLLNNDVPPLGHRIIQQDLARTLEQLAADPESFYQGGLARRIVRGVRRAGGLWTLDDLRLYREKERQPIYGRYRNMRLVSAPPPSSGGIVLALALNVFNDLPESLTEHRPMHALIEAMRRAYRIRALYLGDPDYTDIPIREILSPETAQAMAADIRSDQATASADLPAVPAPTLFGEDTTHFSIIDGDGNRVAATLSINLPFGSGFIVPGTGLLLNDEMDDFSVKEWSPNAYGLVGRGPNLVGPGKRPLSSMTPTFLEHDDGRIAVLGTPGGSRIISMVLLASLDFYSGAGPDSWVNLPRFHHQYLPDEVQFEQGGLTLGQQQELRRLGHALKEIPRRYGNMQVILQEPSGVLSAAADPRGEGAAEVVNVTAPSRCQR